MYSNTRYISQLRTPICFNFLQKIAASSLASFKREPREAWYLTSDKVGLSEKAISIITPLAVKQYVKLHHVTSLLELGHG